ncbi:UNVERIFIED_CONTAM: External alternative NAD(P)H-ubiquinone oxidoreductase B4, mitochondrial [Sesamum radiatum]|uniref:NADH:ubiquinone reductase (non-electrogenic) n=1 Tax=Sesamum radiatum TaxID=300843 RepID=A0AAW2K589_SESRA
MSEQKAIENGWHGGGGGLLAVSDNSPFSTAYADAGQRDIKKKKVVVLEPVGPKKFDAQFREAECYKIDTQNKKVHCRSQKTNVGGIEEFTVDYDYLVIAMGARPNTFNTPGVLEHAYFLKVMNTQSTFTLYAYPYYSFREDAQRIRRTVIDCFERASLPSVSEEERKRILHFVVVGGGPTGVEFSAELHDFVNEDLAKLYPTLKKHVKITLLEASDHILNMFDKRITAFAEQKFHRDGINLKVGSMVTKVTATEISTKEIATGETVNTPYGMVVWSTGIGTRPVVMDFMKQIGQTNRRVLATDEWLRVEGSDCIYALGDCATINQRKVIEDISVIFNKADKNNTGCLKVDDFKEVINDICERYPQVEIHLKKKQLKDFVHLMKHSHGDDEFNIEKFKSSLSEVDSQMKNLPATAQVQTLWAVCSIRWRTNCSSASWRLDFNRSEHTVVMVLCLRQQAGQLAYEDAGDLRLGEAFHIWKGLESNLRRADKYINGKVNNY